MAEQRVAQKQQKISFKKCNKTHVNYDVFSSAVCGLGFCCKRFVNEYIEKTQKF